MIPVAVIGVGYLGRFHAQKYAQIEDVELVGVVDTNRQRAEAVSQELGTRAYTELDQVIDKIQAASIVVPTVDHFQVTRPLIEKGIHCLVEKPITATLEQADTLIKLAREKGVVLQVGHLERFNPAVKVLTSQVTTPLFIEAHRLSPFKPRAIDVDVILDLMIHDLDITLSLVKSPVKEIRAAGVPVLTPKVDIANARLIFESGCTANLTASRISLQTMRRIRVFQPGGYLSADCAEKTSLTVKRPPGLTETKDPMAGLMPELRRHGEVDILKDEIISFVLAIKQGKEPVVTGEDGRQALRLAFEIKAQIQANLDAFGKKLL